MNKFVFTFCLILLIAIKSEAQQRYAIIDRKLKLPVQFADGISDEQLKKGFFAVEKQNIEPLIIKLDSLRKRLRDVARETYDETSLDIGTTRLTVKVIKFPVADRLNVALSTDTGNGYTKEFYIVDGKLTNNDNARYLAKLIKYIKQ
jgi:hypothetical protein